MHDGPENHAQPYSGELEMKGKHAFCGLTVAAALLVGACTDLPTGTAEGGAFDLAPAFGIVPGPNTADNDLTKDLDVSGSGMVAAGVGLDGSGSGLITVDIPAGVINNVLLYWESRDAAVDPSTVTVEVLGVSKDINGEFIGQSFQLGRLTSRSFRADITTEFVFGSGANLIEVTGISLDGASVVVVFDDGSASAVEIRDGNDFAFLKPDPSPSTVTNPQTFTFPASTSERVADLWLIVGDVAGTRGNSVEITVGGVTEEILLAFGVTGTGRDGDEWDTLLEEVTIPPGADELTVQLFSLNLRGNPASLAWVTAGFSVPVEPSECQECKGGVTELTLRNNGPGGVIRVESETVVFEAFVPTGGEFTIFGDKADGKFKKDIKVFVDGVEVAKIHTSCSKPIGPGTIFADFEVVNAVSKDGGTVCPPGPAPECSTCKGKVTELTLSYDGAADADIIVTDKDGRELFNGAVAAGGSFSFSGKDDKGTMTTEITISVNGVDAVTIHTSCSQPIGVGSVFGDFTVLSGASLDGGALGAPGVKCSKSGKVKKEKSGKSKKK